MHAYLLNNYWHTNYRAEQAGLLRFRFVLRPHGVPPPLAVMDLSDELEQPLVVLPASPLPRRAAAVRHEIRR